MCHLPEKVVLYLRRFFKVGSQDGNNTAQCRTENFTDIQYSTNRNSDCRITCDTRDSKNTIIIGHSSQRWQIYNGAVP